MLTLAWSWQKVGPYRWLADGIGATLAIPVTFVATSAVFVVASLFAVRK